MKWHIVMYEVIIENPTVSNTSGHIHIPLQIILAHKPATKRWVQQYKSPITVPQITSPTRQNTRI